MKNGPALSVLLAPGGTTMFWVTQAGCAKAIEVKEAREISVPARTDNNLVISAPDADELSGSPCAKYDEPPARGQTPPGRVTAMAAMLKLDRHGYSAHA